MKAGGSYASFKFIFYFILFFRFIDLIVFFFCLYARICFSFHFKPLSVSSLLPLLHKSYIFFLVFVLLNFIPLVPFIFISDFSFFNVTPWVIVSTRLYYFCDLNQWVLVIFSPLFCIVSISSLFLFQYYFIYLFYTYLFFYIQILFFFYFFF